MGKLSKKIFRPEQDNDTSWLGMLKNLSFVQKAACTIGAGFGLWQAYSYFSGDSDELLAYDQPASKSGGLLRIFSKRRPAKPKQSYTTLFLGLGMIFLTGVVALGLYLYFGKPFNNKNESPKRPKDPEPDLEMGKDEGSRY